MEMYELSVIAQGSNQKGHVAYPYSLSILC